MAKKNWKLIVGSIAPAIGAALGGPLVGVAVKALSSAFLGKEDGTEDELSEVIMNSSPTELLKLRELNQQFETQMKQLDIDVFKLEITDRQSARDMYSVNYWPQVTLTMFFTLGYFALMFLMASGKVTVTNEMLIVVGVLTAAVPQILGFWFGSSYGSKEKTAALASSTPLPGDHV